MMMPFDLTYIVEGCLKATKLTHNFIRQFISQNPAKAFHKFQLIGKRRKLMVRVDALAEGNAESNLHAKLKRYEIVTYGEESLDESINFAEEKNLVVLIDMIDGTDLLERELFNWCSAMVLCYPPTREILVSLVARPDDNLIYFARADIDGAYKIPLRGRGEMVKLSGPDDVRSLASASIAFYGQKIDNFLSVFRNPGLISYLEKLNEEGGNVLTRIYNLAGNPMMMRLVDGHSKIHVVFDLKGWFC